jgi:Ca2+-binding EF-hand superfamily protein
VPTQSTPTTVDTTAVPESVPAAAAAAQDSSAAAQPPGATQVADVVAKEFPNYDKNGDGVLSATEFDAWMVALKTASDPSTKATAPATKTWLTKAFAQADTDKNKKVSKAELTGFLSQG